LDIGNISLLFRLKASIWEGKPWLIKKDKDRRGTAAIVRASGVASKCMLVRKPEQEISSFANWEPGFTLA
jgi:hypothetical protein